MYREWRKLPSLRVDAAVLRNCENSTSEQRRTNIIGMPFDARAQLSDLDWAERERESNIGETCACN